MAAVALPSSPLNNTAAAANTASATTARPAQSRAEGAQRSFARELHKAVDGGPRADARNAAAEAPKEEDTAAQCTADADDARGANPADAPLANAPVDPATLLPGWSPATVERPADVAEAADRAAAELASTDALAAAPKGGERHVRMARDKAAAAGGDAAASAERGAHPAQAGEARDLPATDAGRDSAAAWQALDTSFTPPAAQAGGAHELAALHGSGQVQGAHHGATTELATPAASAPSAFEAQLSAALGSPEFAPALGVQLSILAKEGVQEARLHLNPADMGPIAVQIAVDGQHARVHFQADLAATRDALQASLPDLASAMREAGLMLTGGDVSGGGGRRSGDDTEAGAATGRSEAGVEAQRPDMAAATGRAARAGVVDLYA